MIEGNAKGEKMSPHERQLAQKPDQSLAIRAEDKMLEVKQAIQVWYQQHEQEIPTSYRKLFQTDTIQAAQDARERQKELDKLYLEGRLNLTSYEWGRIYGLFGQLLLYSKPFSSQ